MGAVRSNVVAKLGLFIFPVSVDSVVNEEKETQFNTLCDGTAEGKKQHPPVKVKQSYGCPTCEASGGLKDFKKGKDVGDGSYVIVPQDEIDAAGISDDLKNTLALTAHKAEAVEATTVASGKVYYLTPGKQSFEPYAVVREIVRSRPDLAFCTVWAPRSAPHMYRLRVLNDALVIQELAWPHEVKAAPAVPEDVNAALLPLAEQFVEGIVGDFDPSTFRDTRVDILTAFIESQEAIAAGDAPAPKVATPSGAPSLMEMLQAAVAPVEKKPARKAAAKKAPAKAPARKAS